MSQKIFISHASIDYKIGEKFLDALIEIGINRKDVFYSSKYHTGVKLGKDFNQTVKEALESAEIVIFLLTRSFYLSPYCLNEMGATWIKATPIIPILLDNLTPNDMNGFIDGRHIAYKPDVTESYKILSSLQPYISNPTEADVESVFSDFVAFANEMAEKNSKLTPSDIAQISDTEKMILEHRFTDGEILLLNYFKSIESNEIDCSHHYNDDIKGHEPSNDIIELEKYAALYEIDYKKAMGLLQRSKLASYREDEDYSDYCVFEIDINVFRDLISMSDLANEYFMHTRAKKEIIANKNVHGSGTPKSNKIILKIEDAILSSKLKEIEALTFQYMVDTTSFALGDRWMAEGQIKGIKLWEEENEISNKLSSNYDSALRSLIYKQLVEPSSYTSYGNPREYKLKNEYIEQLMNLSNEAESVLKTVMENNSVALPF